MKGMNAHTGQTLSGLAHLKQSIRDILTTPVGTRVMRRDYGSRLFELVDAPSNRSTLIQIYAATAEALRRWEPRFRLTAVQVDDIEKLSQGRIGLTLEGEYLPDGQTIRMEGLLV